MTESTLHVYFITLEAEGSMTIFDWQRHIEELRSAVCAAVPVADWDATRIYGPTEGEVLPMVCILAPLTMSAAAKLAADLSSTPWFGLPVRIYRANDIVDTLRNKTTKKAAA